RNVSVKRIPNFMGEEKDSKAAAATETAEEELKARTKPKAKSKSKISDSNKATKEELLQYLTEEEYSDKILEIFNSYKTRVAINNGLSKEFRDSQKSSAIYKKLKTLLKEKQKS
ncbi:MAG: hypothetical protein K2H91_09450, partial [Lachnospiraceae bacterium]|nr:hypothetical protein [Lachnospiraceae bacterium]